MATCIFFARKQSRKWNAPAAKSRNRIPACGISQLHGESIDPSKLPNPNGSCQADCEVVNDVGPPYELPANEPPAVELMSNSISSR